MKALAWSHKEANKQTCLKMIIISSDHVKQYEFIQTDDYDLIELLMLGRFETLRLLLLIPLNHIFICKILVLDRNTCNHTIVCSSLKNLRNSYTKNVNLNLQWMWSPHFKV